MGAADRACAVAEVITAATKVEYSPITRNQESVALYFDVDGTKHVMLGARGNCVAKCDANGIPMLTFNFTSLFTIPVEAARPVPNYTAFRIRRRPTSRTPRSLRSAARRWACGHLSWISATMQVRMLIGTEAVRIVDHECVLKTQVEAVALDHL
jgi:hypothetical protein